MRLIECVNAYVAATALYETKCSHRTADALVVLKRRLAPHVELFSKKEMELVEKFAERDEGGKIKWNERKNITFESAGASEEYARLRTELGVTEIAEEFQPLRAPCFEEVTPAQLEALEKFIVFGEGAE